MGGNPPGCRLSGCWRKQRSDVRRQWETRRRTRRTRRASSCTAIKGLKPAIIYRAACPLRGDGQKKGPARTTGAGSVPRQRPQNRDPRCYANPAGSCYPCRMPRDQLKTCCEVCGERLFPRRVTGRYCGSACRQQAWRDRHDPPSSGDGLALLTWDDLGRLIWRPQPPITSDK